MQERSDSRWKMHLYVHTVSGSDQISKTRFGSDKNIRIRSRNLFPSGPYQWQEPDLYIGSFITWANDSLCVRMYEKF